MNTDFPNETATIRDRNGFPHSGYLTDQRDDDNCTALYYFPGDFIAGDGFEFWLDPWTAGNQEALQAYYDGEDD